MSGEGRSQRILITRPANATAYTAGDAIGDVSGSAILAFTDLLTPKIPFMVMSASLRYDVAALPVGMTCTLELYSASPTAIADNAAWDLVAADRALHLGSINFGAPADRGSTLKSEIDIINKVIMPGASRTLFAILVASGGFTPAGNSEVLAVTIAGTPL